MKMSVPSYWCRAAIKASIDPISRWVVGSSIRRRLGGSRRSLTRARRDFSPPLRTPTVLKTSSPRKERNRERFGRFARLLGSGSGVPIREPGVSYRAYRPGAGRSIRPGHCDRGVVRRFEWGGLRRGVLRGWICQLRWVRQGPYAGRVPLRS